MKKIVLFLGLLGIVSCCAPVEEEVKKTEGKVLKIETDSHWYTIFAFRFNYGGHTYISFTGTRDISEILHDPECLKCRSHE